MRSIAVKLTLAFLVVSVLGVALAAVYARLATQSAFNSFVLDRAENEYVYAAANYYAAHGNWAGVQTALPQGPASGPGGPPGEAPFALVDRSGLVVAPNREFGYGATVPPEVVQRGLPVLVNGEEVGRVLVPEGPPQLDPREQQYLQRTTLALLEGAATAIVVALIVGFLLARSLMRPVREMTAAVRRVEQGHLEQQVPVRSRDELGKLAAAFNGMSASLNESIRMRRQMTADIAHDLRSPLAVMAGYLESLRDGVLKPSPERFEILYAEALHLQRLVEDLRTLSLADAGELSITRTPTSPGELLVRLSAAYQGQAEARGIDLAVEIPADLPAVEVDQERMVQVLGNLVRNALTHTPAGGTITLSARRCDGAVALAVRDTGTGMPAEVLAHVFERFYRGDAARHQEDASGLGLAIAKALVELHGGSISARSAGPGQGSEFTVQLPAA